MADLHHTGSGSRDRQGLFDGPEALPWLIDRLHALARGRDTVSLDDIAKTIGAQGHAPLLMVASVIMVLPVGMVPGVGGALGALVALIGLNMLAGGDSLRLPRALGRREIPADRLRRTAERIKPVAVWLKRHLHVRMEYLSRGSLSLAVISLILILSGVSLLIVGAVPVATPIMSLPIALFAFGILGRDGAVVAAGYGVYVAATVAVWLLL